MEKTQGHREYHRVQEVPAADVEGPTQVLGSQPFWKRLLQRHQEHGQNSDTQCGWRERGMKYEMNRGLDCRWMYRWIPR